jgi:hypothetical protein
VAEEDLKAAEDQKAGAIEELKRPDSPDRVISRRNKHRCAAKGSTTVRSLFGEVWETGAIEELLYPRCRTSANGSSRISCLQYILLNHRFSIVVLY